MVRITKVPYGKNEVGMYKGRMVRNKRRAPTNKQLNKKIKKLQRDVETKFHDVYVTGDVHDQVSTPAFSLLNGVAKGDENYEREGGEIRATSLQWRVRFANFSGDANGTNIRMVIFWDRQANGAIPGLVGNLTTNALFNLDTITTGLQWFQNPNTWARYKILYDKTFNIPNNSGNVTTHASVFKTGRIKLNRYVKYDAPEAIVASIPTNALYVYFVSDQPAATDDFVQVVGGFRFYFKDS